VAVSTLKEADKKRYPALVALYPYGEVTTGSGSDNRLRVLARLRIRSAAR
jgi:hypothetical protein